MKTWRESPARLVTDLLGVTPEPWQAKTLGALAKPGAHISVRSGHGVGKSALDSWAILWHHITHYPAKTPCSAPTMHQLRDVLWSELGVWLKRLPESFQQSFSLRSSDQDMRFYLLGAAEESFAVGRTGRKENPEALQGFHSENLLFILDEASGIDDIIFQVARGSLTGKNARVLMTSNPTRASGYFHASHHENRELWWTLKVASDESSQVSGRYAEEVAKEYGEDSNVYRVRVLGEFPRADEDVVIPLDLVEEALQRDVATIPLPVVWGVDVARFGDDRTAIVKRQANYVFEKPIVWRNLDLMQTAGRIIEEYRNAPPPAKPAAILVDVIGLGAGVVDRLKEQQLPVRGVNVAESPAVGERFMRLRDELWFKARDWFMSREVKIVEDAGLISELVTPSYAYTSSGKMKIESKDDLRKRGMASPDIADAFVLTFAAGDRLHIKSRKDVKRRRMAIV